MPSETSELYNLMETVVKWLHAHARANRLTVDDHHTLYHDCAACFRLYKDGTAPTWLSRVVAGVLRDIEEKNGDDV